MLISFILNSNIRILEGERNDPHASFYAVGLNVLIFSFSRSTEGRSSEKSSFVLADSSSIALSSMHYSQRERDTLKKAQVPLYKNHSPPVDFPNFVRFRSLREGKNCALYNYSHVLYKSIMSLLR